MRHWNTLHYTAHTMFLFESTFKHDGHTLKPFLIYWMMCIRMDLIYKLMPQRDLAHTDAKGSKETFVVVFFFSFSLRFVDLFAVVSYFSNENEKKGRRRRWRWIKKYSLTMCLIFIRTTRIRIHTHSMHIDSAIVRVLFAVFVVVRFFAIRSSNFMKFSVCT